MNAITGGAGFIGSHLVDVLHKGGRGCRVLDGLVARPGDPGDRLRERTEKLPDGVEFIHADLHDRRALRRLLPGCKRVFHLAHFVGANPSTSDTPLCLRTNVLGTQALLEEMEQEGVDQLILMSTAAVYGELNTTAHAERQAPQPTNPYGASMAAAEALACSWQAQTGGSLVILRPFNVYGPRMRPDAAIYRFLAASHTFQSQVVFGDGQATRDFVYISDVLKVLAESRRVSSRSRPTILNICSGVETSLMELVNAIGRTTGASPKVEFRPRQAEDPIRSVGCRKRLDRVFDLTEPMGLDDGLNRTYGWLAHALRRHLEPIDP